MNSAFQQLQKELTLLQEAFQALHVTVVEDKPLGDDVVLADRLDDSAADLIGLLEEALEAGQAPRVVLRATHEAALSYCSLADLKRYAIDLA